MTTGTKAALHNFRLLVSSNGKVDHFINPPEEHPTRGDLTTALLSILLDDRVTHCYVSGTNLYLPLSELNQSMRGIPGWRMRIANRRRHAYSVGGKTTVVGRFFVDYFAIDEKRTKSERAPRRRFDVINLDLMYERPSEDPDVQLQMTLSLLEMCEHRGIRIRGTKGALGSAMLKRSVKWEKGRTSAPRFINREARKYLPGNFYAVSRRVKSEHLTYDQHRTEFRIPHCYYIDQTSSHHSIALQCPLPHPQSVRARGRYKNALKGEPRRWCDPDSLAAQEIFNNHHGVVLCKVNVGHIPPTMTHLYPPWAKRGTRHIWIWTPEFRLFEGDHRLQLDSLCCAFTGTELDPVLPEYAQWAKDEILIAPDRSPYKKGALLSAYGMLAFNSEKRDLYRYWGGESSRTQVEIPGAGMVGESVVKIPDHVELSTVNVVARGLIEAETRTRSIEYAREIHSQGLEVPQIYADGILVATDALPFIPDGWRVSHSLTNVHIPRPNAIISDQIVKLPGVSGDADAREWERQRERAMVAVGGGRVSEELTGVS